MKAALLTEHGLALAEIPVPQPKPPEILVKVRASSLNRADLLIRDGKAHGTIGGSGTVLGLEWSGDVIEVGSEVTAYRPGDRVMCSGIGGFAEYAVTDWRRASPFPSETVSYETAACLSVALRTTHTSIVDIGQFKCGETMLVLGASSGVGLVSLQVGKLLGASVLIGTSTKADRREALAKFGAGFALDSNDPSWVKQVLELTNGRGVDLVVDFLSGPHVNESMRATRLGGRIVNIGRMAGETGQFDFDLHAMRRIQYLGQTFRTRTLEEVGDIAQRVRTDFWPALLKGQLGVPIDMKLPLDKVDQAFNAMRANKHFGKIVLTQ